MIIIVINIEMTPTKMYPYIEREKETEISEG
jgi:hypothetical protein